MYLLRFWRGRSVARATLAGGRRWWLNLDLVPQVGDETLIASELFVAYLELLATTGATTGAATTRGTHSMAFSAPCKAAQGRSPRSPSSSHQCDPTPPRTRSTPPLWWSGTEGRDLCPLARHATRRRDRKRTPRDPRAPSATPACRRTSGLHRKSHCAHGVKS